MKTIFKYWAIPFIFLLLINIQPVAAEIIIDNVDLNPAAVYCNSLGYQYNILTNDEGEYGVCILPDGQIVDEWQFFLGDAGQEYNYCALKGYNTGTSTDPNIASKYMTGYVAVCVLPDSSKVEVGELMHMNYDLIGWKGDQENRPVFDPIIDTNTEEGMPIEIVLKANDPNNDPLTFSLATPPSGAILNGDKFQWTPSIGQAGTYHIAFTVNDGDLEAFQYANIVVKAHVQNRPPVLQNPGDQTITEGITLTLNLVATDPDNDPFTFSFTSIKELLGAFISGNTFKWTPVTGSAGKYSVTFNVTDTGGLSDEEKINITVNAPTTNVQTNVKIVPKTINLGSKGYFLTFVTLPEAYKGATIDMKTVSCSGAKAVRMVRPKIFPRIAVFVFKTSDLNNVEVEKRVTLTVEGELKHKSSTYSFTGSDTVKVINKPTWQPDDIKDVSTVSDDQLFKKYPI
jgi:putative hemolysin